MPKEKIKLPSHAGKVRRQGIMMKDTAMVLLCYDMTRRRKDRVILELSIPKPGGMCYHPNLTRSEVGRDRDGLEDYTLKNIRESALNSKFGLSLPLYL